jgi:hypothetical protein
MSGGLSRAFRDTAYLAEGAVARIGRRSASMEALLRRLEAGQGVFLSAWNPMAKPRPLAWNHRAQARLWRMARRRRFVPARSQPRPAAHARWGEDQIFLAADLRVALRLARYFRQLAVVAVRHDGKAKLVWLKF